MTNSTSYSKAQRYLAASLLPLLATDAIDTLIMYHYSVDRGVWPLFLIFVTVVSFIYAWLTLAIARLSGCYRAKLVLNQNLCLGAVRLIMSLLYFLLKPDWLAVNNGHARLTAFQTLVYWRWTPFIVYALFLVALAMRSFGGAKEAHRCQ